MSDEGPIHPDAHGIVADILHQAGLPTAVRDRLSLTGTTPLLPTSFRVGIAAQGAIAAAALAATELGRWRGGNEQEVSVDMHDAEYECTGYFRLNGVVPNPWAPLSGLYACRDGFVRIHANFDHHRDGALQLLGIHDDPTDVTRDQVSEALAGWPAEAFEGAAAEAGIVVAAVRSFEDWDGHPQSTAVAMQPLFTIERIGEAAPLPLAPLDSERLPLTGVRVLDLTRILAGPVCGRTLAAYGADVMLINSPHLPNIDSIAETSRGKLSALVDLDQPEDAERFRKLVAGTHVFVQGYRPGGLAARGFGPEDVAALQPGVVYVSLSAYGSEGLWRDRRGFDSLVQSATGFNLAEAEAAGEEKPKPLPVQILDYASGFLMAFAGQAALLKQQQEGGSWHVRVSLARTAHWLRSLGRIDYYQHAAKPDFNVRLESYDSGFGKLEAIPHAAGLSVTPPAWHRPSMPPGSHPPQWPQ